MKAGAHLSLAGALAFGLILGCQASVNADANVSGEGAKGKAEAELEGSAEGQGEMTRSSLAASSGNALAGASAAPSRVLLGARHDLKLRPGKATANCECLSVALGGARSSGMVWGAVPPELDDGMQLTIALSSDGQTCKGEPKKSLGASYWGYRLSGNDVIVLVEDARGGRPLTAGAVIPKPVGAGQVYVAPAFKKLPYGRPLEGKGLCKIGNPGQLRTAPFSELEVGADAPPKAAKGELVGGPGQTNQAADQSSETPMTVDMSNGD